MEIIWLDKILVNDIQFTKFAKVSFATILCYTVCKLIKSLADSCSQFINLFYFMIHVNIDDVSSLSIHAAACLVIILCFVFSRQRPPFSRRISFLVRELQLLDSKTNQSYLQKWNWKFTYAHTYVGTYLVSSYALHDTNYILTQPLFFLAI